jgi:CrcB protein
MGFLLVCVGAALGAPARYLTDRVIQSHHDTLVPWGTMTVNVAGSLILGLLTGVAETHDVPEAVMLAVGTGLCGALTTYSTFSYETFRLYEAGARLYAALNVAMSLLAGLGAALIGLAIGSSF